MYEEINNPSDFTMKVLLIPAILAIRRLLTVLIVSQREQFLKKYLVQ